MPRHVSIPPLSRRGFFLTASAATAAGYTLAAGPVRADAIHTESAGLTVGDAKVKVRTVPHVGITNGYRIEMGGAVVAYISDHQQPMDGGMEVPDHVVELPPCRRLALAGANLPEQAVVRVAVDPDPHPHGRYQDL